MGHNDEGILVTVARVVGGLTDPERNDLMFTLLRNHGNEHAACADKPWFSKVEALFDEGALDKAVRDAVVQFIEDGAGRS